MCLYGADLGAAKVATRGEGVGCALGREGQVPAAGRVGPCPEHWPLTECRLGRAFEPQVGEKAEFITRETGPEE